MAAILPGSTIGVIGGGQLGRMLALEARWMGYRVIVLDPKPGSPAAQVADDQICAPLDDADAARELARRSDVVTLEWENADAATVRSLEEITPVRPGAHVLEIAQHRVREKDAARRLGLPTAPYRSVDSLGELKDAIRELGTPAVLKTTRGGYDGKGQAVIRDPAEAESAFTELGGGGLILEGFVDFRLEASVITARTPSGEISSFPIGENVHEKGVLDLSIVPARASERVHRRAREIGEALVEGLDVIGLLAVELFVGEDDELYMNEMAPRPHNSGHYSWEACGVSQFEQQLRAVCDLPLGDPALLRPACMANLLGHHIGNGVGLPGTPDALALPLVSLHLYGKDAARPGRKMGHLTALADSPDEALERASRARDLLTANAAGAPER
ncbi:MAG TPA: 5-(carboxyamino)imidazole ribonucleotide synthase [Longimicrobiaceae bacterium]|nr:5-(carboxyamino)imidazole ribonucleotide synthase [Longimicrobiaceae bacterium]